MPGFLEELLFRVMLLPTGGMNSSVLLATFLFCGKWAEAKDLYNDEQQGVSLQGANSNTLMCTVNSVRAAFVITAYAVMVSVVSIVFLRRNNFRLQDEATPHLRRLLRDRHVLAFKWVWPFLLVLFISKLTNFNIQLPGVCAAMLLMPVARLCRTLLADPRSLWDRPLWSGTNPLTMVSEVKDVFIDVHRVTNDALCISHIIGYWPGILKFFQGNLCDYVFWVCIMMIL